MKNTYEYGTLDKLPTIKGITVVNNQPAVVDKREYISTYRTRFHFLLARSSARPTAIRIAGLDLRRQLIHQTNPSPP